MADRSPIIEKIVAGLQVSFDRLVDQKAARDEELIFADQNGAIVRVKVKELQAQRIAAAKYKGENQSEIKA